MDAFKSKRDALSAFLDKGMTMVHLDARREGVVVPDHFVGQQDLRLNLSYRFAGSHMEVGEELIEATLTFGGAPFRVTIPFVSVYALTSHVTGAGLVFPESLPDDILSALHKEMELEAVAAVEEAGGSMPAELRSERRSKRSERSDAPGKPTKAPHLRVINGDKK